MAVGRAVERDLHMRISACMGNEVEDLRDHAERCRRLARVVDDERNKRLLLEMASRLDEQADRLEESTEG